jgi:hypothetical protein
MGTKNLARSRHIRMFLAWHSLLPDVAHDGGSQAKRSRELRQFWPLQSWNSP